MSGLFVIVASLKSSDAGFETVSDPDTINLRSGARQTDVPLLCAASAASMNPCAFPSDMSYRLQDSPLRFTALEMTVAVVVAALWGAAFACVVEPTTSVRAPMPAKP
jgi:hypothetical protein